MARANSFQRHQSRKSSGKAPTSSRRNNNNSSNSKFSHRRRPRRVQEPSNNHPATTTTTTTTATNIRRHTKNNTDNHRTTFLPNQLNNISKNSIHSEWKRQLGSLIRWYINLTSQLSKSQDELDNQLNQLYTQNNCDPTKVKQALLEAIVKEEEEEFINTTTTTFIAQQEEKEDWLRLDMALEHDTTLQQQDDDGDYKPSCNGKGLLLQQIRQKGQGPAHSLNEWNIVKVPNWAIGKPFFFQVSNRTPLPLSCEMTIDSQTIARNAPIPKTSIRTITPDNQRYFESHKWVIQPSQRINLSEFKEMKKKKKKTHHQNDHHEKTTQQQQQSNTTPSRTQSSSIRYNQKRPDYQGRRVSLQDFPDPTSYGWTFTGSKQESYVEFFEIKLQNGIGGRLVKLDFYYTTGTVKTILHHPTTGINQLFRKCIVNSQMYNKILKNPRFHTRLGYRRRQQRRDQHEQHQPQQLGVPQSQQDDDDNDDDDEIMEEVVTITQTDDTPPSNNNNESTIFFAKNENYNFQQDGHINRIQAMNQLAPTQDFQAWKDAASHDWACVHAKFYISRPHRLRPVVYDNMKNSKTRRNNKQQKMKKKEHVPEMTPIVNIKAAESATLSCQFHSTNTGTSMNNNNKERRKSIVRMERVNGLNDDLHNWKADPVFEMKLYYRAESTLLNNNGNIDDYEDDDMENNDNDLESDKNDMNDDTSNNNDDNLVEMLRDEMPLNNWKSEKLKQLQMWFQDNKALDRNEAEARRTEAQNSIANAVDAKSVDEALQSYWDWHQKQEWI